MEDLWNSFLIHLLNCLKIVEVLSQANLSFGQMASSCKLQLAFFKRLKYLLPSAKHLNLAYFSDSLEILASYLAMINY